MKGCKQKEAVPASDTGAPELDPALANKSGPQLDSDSAQASIEGPLIPLSSTENQELAAEQLSEGTVSMKQLTLTNPGSLQIDKMLTLLRENFVETV